MKIIQLKNISKEFIKWEHRPNSIQEVLNSFSQGKMHWGSITRVAALKTLSLELHQGEFLGIIGKQGSGKSTLLKILGGIMTISSGEFEMYGSVAPLIELGAGFQHDLSGYDNIFLVAALLGISEKKVQSKLSEILDFADLGHLIHEPLKKYSSNEIVRLGFTLTTHLDASLILLDEIFAVGDLKFQAKCLQKITDLQAQGKTFVLVSHSPETLKKFCTRCIVLEAHEKIFDGSVEQALEVYQNLI